MTVTKVKLHYAAFANLRRSDGVAAELAGHAERIAGEAGEGFEAQPVKKHGGITGRARASVVAESFKARLLQANESIFERIVGNSTWKR